MELNRFKLGQITSAVGLKGEVKVYPYTDYKERFEELSWLFIEEEKVSIEKVRYQGEVAIIKFAGIDDRNQAEVCRSKYLYIDRANARKLPSDTYFIADLIGLEVVTEDGLCVGKLKDVISGAAQDLYEVEKDEAYGQGKGSFLIPAVSEFIIEIDMQKQKIIVNLIEGLM